MTTEFAAVSQIGKGLKPLAQNGEVAISNGTLHLRDSKGQEIVSAPVRDVAAKAPWYTLGNGARVTVAGTSYFLSLKSLAGAAVGASLPAVGVLVGRKSTKTFLRALKAAQSEAGAS